VLSEQPHARFRRKGDDLIAKRSLTLTQALCGIKFHILGIDGTQLEVDTTNDGVIAPGTHKTIPGQGMVNSKTLTRGNLIIEFEVIFPKGAKLTPEQKSKIISANLP
jgi:DnaJ family protein A protein 2